MTYETYSNFKSLNKSDLVFQIRSYIKTPFKGDVLKSMTKKQLLNIALESKIIPDNVYGCTLKYEVA